MIETIAIIGAGNGGKAAAADLSLRGKRVRLFEFPEYAQGLAAIREEQGIAATGEVQGHAWLAAVTTDMEEAVDRADMVMVCTQALTHSRVAHGLALLMDPGMLLWLNPGSSVGSLRFAQVFREAGVDAMPTIVENSTLTYGCRGRDAAVDVYLKVRRVVYGVFPAAAADSVAAEAEALYPCTVRGKTVLEAGLNNANPVIHPAIALLNAARIENEGANMRFYADGMSPAAAQLIEALDRERMALLEALGYPAQTDPQTSVQQGYADSTDYLECYRDGSVFQQVHSPDSLECRFLHEDVGVGLVFMVSLAELFRVAVPACCAVVRTAGAIVGRDYMAEGAGSLDALGLAGLTVAELKRYLETGRRPSD